MTARDQPDNAAHVAGDVVNVSRGKPILYVSTDELFIAQADNAKVIVAVGLEIMLGTRRRAVQLALQLTGYFYTNK
jgi:hypothetical protein